MNCIFLRRGYGEIESGVNYVEYIESSGTQYINTGFKPSNNTKIVTVVSDYPTTDASTTVWGTQSSSSDRYDFFITAGGAYRSYYYGASANFDSTISYDGKVTIERNATSIKIGDYSQTNTAKTFTCTTPLYIFAHNNNGSVNKQATIKLYSCQIYESGVLVKDYMPCLDPDGVACLYDKVNKEYVYNAGTGTFTAGASISGGSSGGDSNVQTFSVVTNNGTYTYEFEEGMTFEEFMLSAYAKTYPCNGNSIGLYWYAFLGSGSVRRVAIIETDGTVTAENIYTDFPTVSGQDTIYFYGLRTPNGSIDPPITDVITAGYSYATYED